MEPQQMTCILHKASTVYRTELSEEAQQASFFTEGTRGKNMAMPPPADTQLQHRPSACLSMHSCGLAPICSCRRRLPGCYFDVPYVLQALRH